MIMGVSPLRGQEYGRLNLGKPKGCLQVAGTAKRAFAGVNGDLSPLSPLFSTTYTVVFSGFLGGVWISQKITHACPLQKRGQRGQACKAKVVTGPGCPPPAGTERGQTGTPGLSARGCL